MGSSTITPLKGDAKAVRVALNQRLAEAARIVLGEDWFAEQTKDDLDAATLLPLLLDSYAESGDDEVLWLILVAVSARFPSPEIFQQARRRFRLDPRWVFETFLYNLGYSPETRGRLTARMQVVTDPIVDVGSTARFEGQHGIHRVVREVVSSWAPHHTFETAAWDRNYAAYQTLTRAERERLAPVKGEGGGPRAKKKAAKAAAAAEAPHSATVATADAASGTASVAANATSSAETNATASAADEAKQLRVDVDGPDILVPWRSTIIMPDVPATATAPALACMGRYTNNTLCTIGHDLIPIVSADLRPHEEPGDMALWLSGLKFTDKVAAISKSAGEEFSGFTSALASQGVTGPEVKVITEPSDTKPHWFHPAPKSARVAPILVFSGAREPHKNQLALLHAAEHLWRQGLQFEVRFVGGLGCAEEVQDFAEELMAKGRPIVWLGRVSERRLWEELANADAVCFISMHEGYGLPVVEALAVGTPVLTSNYGSQAQIAKGGGCLTVDPRDDKAIEEAMRELITNEDLRTQLAFEARHRKKTTWGDYAEKIWDFFVPEPEESSEDK